MPLLGRTTQMPPLPYSMDYTEIGMALKILQEREQEAKMTLVRKAEEQESTR